jgi:hypothetical protein
LKREQYNYLFQITVLIVKKLTINKVGIGMKKHYRVSWQDIVSRSVLITASSEKEALSMFDNGEGFEPHEICESSCDFEEEPHIDGSFDIAEKES